MTHSTRPSRIAVVIAALLLPATLPGAAPDAEAIVRRGERALRGESSQLLMTMQITRPTFTRRLKLRSWALGKQKSLVEILEPAKEEGIVSLRVDNQMWNYLPKTDQVVRVPLSLMLQSWMGSDLTNDDLMKLSSLVTDYTHQWLRQEKLDGVSSVLIQCTPKPNAPVVWGKILYWARASDHLPLKEEYYDEQGKLVRTLVFSDFKRMDDRVLPARMTIAKPDSPGESTTLVYDKALYNRVIDEDLFNREQLRRTSQMGKNSEAGWNTQRLPPAMVN